MRRLICRTQAFKKNNSDTVKFSTCQLNACDHFSTCIIIVRRVMYLTRLWSVKCLIDDVSRSKIQVFISPEILRHGKV